MNRRTALFFGSSMLAALTLGATDAFAAGQDTKAKTSEDPKTGDDGAIRHETFEYAPPVAAFLAKAEAAKPKLIETVQGPVALVQTVADAAQPLGWRVEKVADATAIADKVLHKGDSMIIDFEGHRTGHLSFDLIGVGRGVDAPARLRLIFGEVVTDVAEPFHPYKGMLSESWLPEEIVTIDYLPQSVRLPRRYAFRFVKVEVIDTSPNFGISFRNLKAHGLSAANGVLPSLPIGMPADLRRIDEVAGATLRDCMQTTFEDGPRRDQRLWTGDLRLQALTSYCTFSNNDLVKRCLYLLAAFPRADGLLAGCVFEYPAPSHGHEFLGDYAVFFAVALADYVNATGDKATGADLWPSAKKQFDVLSQYIGADGIFAAPKDLWIFVDWNQKLEKSAAMQAIYIFGLKRLVALAGQLGLQSEIKDYPARIRAMEAAAIKTFYDKPSGMFRSGPDHQISLASQAWMTIAGVGDRKLQARALKTALAVKDAIRPNTPYLNHYVVEALFLAGCTDDALALMRAYWGGMVKAGADTFWEAYSPEQPKLAPYGDFHINSFCHAWSCTPSYLLRTYKI